VVVLPLSQPNWTTCPNALVDHGFMVQHGFADLDGRQWDVFWMDERAAPKQM
jgi:predicted lactoylglutathione lyase